MSYDIRFGVKVAGAPDGVYAVIGEPELANPTYNNAQIFRKSMGLDFSTSEWYKVTDIVPYLEHGIHELQFNRAAYVDLEPDNGWGGIQSSLRSLQSILKWITEDREGTWNADVPLECIYMTW